MRRPRPGSGPGEAGGDDLRRKRQHRDRAYFGSSESEDHCGHIEAERRDVFGRYAAEPDVLIGRRGHRRGRHTAADPPNQLGVAYHAHVIESALAHGAPALGWR